MAIKLKILVILFTVIVINMIASCSNNSEYNTYNNKQDIKIINNKSTPQNSKFSVNIKEILKLSGNGLTEDALFTNPSSFDIDSQGNLFILDKKSHTVKKFNEDGRFIKSFARKGVGPGEFRKAVHLSIIQDTLFIGDIHQKKMVKFDLNGSFCGFIDYGGKNLLDFNSCQSNGILGYSIYPSKDGNEKYINLDLKLLNKDLSSIAVLKQKRFDRKPGAFSVIDLMIPYSSSSKNIYHAKVSETEYEIDVSNMKGDLIKKIRKRYRSVVFKKKELKRLNHIINKIETKAKYKKAINYLLYDNTNDYLWVSSSIERNQENEKLFFADIYKDGIFINKISLDIGLFDDFYNPGIKMKIKKGKLYILNEFSSSLKVYSIEYQN